MRGLYIHIPFCAKKCHYCDFVVTSKGEPSKRARFLKALALESDSWSRRLRKVPFDTLYLGGGTPSALESAEAEKLFELLETRFRFKEGAERTIETNPGDITPKKAALYRDAGFTRVSLGAQSFNKRTLAAANRDHDEQAIETAFEALRGAGFRNISLDLILSLPGESIKDAHFSLERAIALEPEHISLYELTIEKATVFGALHHQGRLELPHEDEALETLNFARQFLTDNGYRHYELLSYAKPGYESRHNLLYWANEEYLGLGPGAVSYMDGRRFKHSASYEEYMNKTEKGDWSAIEEESLRGERKEAESFILSLRLSDGAARERFSDIMLKLEEPLHRLKEQGLVVIDERATRLTPKGRLFAETVFSELVLK